MVNTFFVHPNPKVTARLLDDKRLGKQRIECIQIIDTLEGRSKSWINHPAVKMWRGYTDALKDYFNIMVEEWIERGKNNNLEFYELKEDPEYPPWADMEKIWFSHQSRLLSKDPVFYAGKFNPPKYCLDYGYIWPSKWTIEELEDLDYEDLCEPYKEEPICTGVKKSGEKCSFKAKFGDKCKIHAPKDFKVEKCAGTLKDGRPCSYKAKTGSEYCGRHEPKE
jgi:hypothetical protein